MCGIFGQIGPDPPVADCGLALRHRGPDDSGAQDFQVAGTGLHVNLSHRRLSIIDLSPAGHQPMSNEDGTVWIIFNGEIYNFQELRPELVAAGHRFRSRTDTEAIVHGYEEWGDQVVPRLRGMFALAIWDVRRRRLLLARDRVGKKPLFYSGNGREFFFASEIKAILATGRVQAEMDPVALHDYLTYFYFPPPRTAFRSIFKLPPASCMTVQVESDGTLRQHQSTYWDPVEAAGSAPRLSRRDAVERTRELMEEAVRLRLISDVPLGIFLSGGIDSSTITALASRTSSERVKTFSISFPESKFYDEIPFANLVAERFGTEHHILRPDAHCTEFLTKVVRHFDEPFGNPTAILEYILTKLMREHVTVALSGEGGDELFGGYVRYSGAWLAGHYQKLPRFLTKGLISRLSSLLSDDTEGRHGFRRLREFVEFGWQPQQEMYLNWVGYFSEVEKRALYADAFATQVGDYGSDGFLRDLFARGAKLDPMNRLGYVDLASFLCCNCLEYSDRMSMANSMEVRCPFTDHKLIEFALHLPYSFKFHNLQTKWVVKEAMRGILPERVLNKKKVGFNPPLPIWLNHELKPFVEQLLSPAAIRRRGIFRPEAIATLLRDHAENRRDNALKIWALLMLEVWQRMYLDGEAEAAVLDTLSTAVA